MVFSFSCCYGYLDVICLKQGFLTGEKRESFWEGRERQRSKLEIRAVIFGQDSLAGGHSEERVIPEPAAGIVGGHHSLVLAEDHPFIGVFPGMGTEAAGGFDMVTEKGTFSEHFLLPPGWAGAWSLFLIGGMVQKSGRLKFWARGGGFISGLPYRDMLLL
jgi:hypothetical protein